MWTPFYGNTNFMYLWCIPVHVYLENNFLEQFCWCHSLCYAKSAVKIWHLRYLSKYGIKLKILNTYLDVFYLTLHVRLMIWRSVNVQSDGDMNSQVWFLEDSNWLCLKRQLWKIKLFYRFLFIKGCTSWKKFYLNQ